MAAVFEAALDRIEGTLLRGVEPGVGARQTPRRTSPALAARTTVNFSLDAPDAVALASTSVTDTSRLGSAPWSPLELTVDVTAHTVTVPSPFTLPVRLRSPSVAGLRDVG